MSPQLGRGKATISKENGRYQRLALTGLARRVLVEIWFFSFTLIDRLVIVGDALTTFRTDPPDPRLADPVRRDRADPMDGLSRANLAPELQRSTLASHMGRLRCLAAGVHDRYRGARVHPPQLANALRVRDRSSPRV